MQGDDGGGGVVRCGALMCWCVFMGFLADVNDGRVFKLKSSHCGNQGLQGWELPGRLENREGRQAALLTLQSRESRLGEEIRL